MTTNPSKYTELRRLRKALGWTAALRLLLAASLDSAASRPRKLWTRHAMHPLLCRPSTSDPEVFRDVFRKQAFRCLNDVPDPRLVIDCGANVGYVSAWLLSRFPHCKVIAVEPDPGNFDILSRNLAPYGNRAACIQAAVWPRQAPLRIADAPYRDGREWAVQIRECTQGEPPNVQAIDIGTLLANSGESTISILKIDIEAGEQFLFAENYQSWIARVDNLAIELHDDDCSRIFHNAIAGLPLDITHCGELTVCKRRVDS